MRHHVIHTASPMVPARHARLFELIRQQARARRVSARLAESIEPDPDTLAAASRRAAASWQKLR